MTNRFKTNKTLNECLKISSGVLKKAKLQRCKELSEFSTQCREPWPWKELHHSSEPNRPSFVTHILTVVYIPKCIMMIIRTRTIEVHYLLNGPCTFDWTDWFKTWLLIINCSSIYYCTLKCKWTCLTSALNFRAFIYSFPASAFLKSWQLKIILTKLFWPPQYLLINTWTYNILNEKTKPSFCLFLNVDIFCVCVKDFRFRTTIRTGACFWICKCCIFSDV